MSLASFRSWPALKALPAPIRTTARMSGSFATRPRASESSPLRARLSALSTRGRLRVITAMPAFCSKRMLEYMRLALDPVALERVGIDRRAQAGRIRETDHATVEVDRIFDHVAGHLQRPDRFAPRHDRVARRGHRRLGQRREGEAEAVAHDHTETGRGRALDHLPRAQESPLLHDLDLHDVRGFAADDLDQRGRSRHALVGHERDVDGPADLGEAGEVGARDRLLDEGQRVRLELPDERHGFGEREALVEIYPEPHAAADRRANGGDAGHALGAGARYLDLRGGEPATQPL